MGDQTAQFTEEYCAEKMNKTIALIIALLVAVAASSEISRDSNERVVPEESLVATSDEFVPAVHHGPPVGTVIHHGGGVTSHKLGKNVWGVTGHHKVTTKFSAENAHKMVKQHMKQMKQSKKHIFKIQGKVQKQIKKRAKKHKSLVKKHVKSVKNLFSKVKGLAKKGKKGAIKKLMKKHVKSVKNLFSKVKRLAKKGKKGAIKKLIKKHVRKLKRRVNKHVKWHFRRGRSSRRSRRSSRRSGRSIRQRGTKWECSWNHNPWFPCTPRPGDVVVPPYNGYWTRRHRKRSVRRRL